MIVLGTFYVQTTTLDSAAILAGSVMGLLSATVLFINAFPDYKADKSAGRHTLVIMLGYENAVKIFPFFFAAAYSLVVVAVLLGLANVYALATLASLPLAVKASMQARKADLERNELVPAMASTVMYSRVTGFILAASFLLRFT
jgi:1,4-dihydroxy-2-naphthoate octaprenyltransferase